MTVWIENFSGCTCAYICLYKRDLPGQCPVHATRSIGTSRELFYKGEIGYIDGEAEE